MWKSIDLVGQRHRGHKMFLKLRFERRLDLFDPRDGLLDLAAIVAVEQTHARTGARRIADRLDLVEVAIGDEAENHRIFRIDERAEGAGKADAIDMIDALLVEQQFDAGIKRRLGELDGAHVVLGDGDALLTLMHEIGEGAAVRQDAGAAFGQ